MIFKLHHWFKKYHVFVGPGKYAGFPIKECLSWQTSQLCIVVELAVGGSVAVTVGVAVAAAVAMAMDVAVFVGFIAFGATICTRQDI